MATIPFTSQVLALNSLPRILQPRISTLSFAFGLYQASGWFLKPLSDLFPSIVLAVPKSKVSHSRKAMRSANKGLKDKQNIVHCPACGSPKLAHHLCSNCYNFLSRMWKKGNRGDNTPDVA